MSHSAIIREVSSCSIWGQIQRPTTGQYAETDRQTDRQTLEHQVLYGMSPSNPSPQGSWSYEEKEAERWWEPVGMEYIKETRPLNTTGLTHIWTHRNCGSMHRSKMDRGSTLREKETWAPIPNQEAISKWQLLAKEKVVFSKGVSPGIQITFKGRPHAQQQMANTKWSQWYLWSFVVVS